MITQFILQIFFSVTTFIFSPVPSIPPMPEEIIAGAEYFQDLITSIVGLISYVYSPLIFLFVFTMLIIVLNFEAIYHFIMWIVRKLPFGIN